MNNHSHHAYLSEKHEFLGLCYLACALIGTGFGTSDLWYLLFFPAVGNFVAAIFSGVTARREERGDGVQVINPSDL